MFAIKLCTLCSQIISLDICTSKSYENSNEKVSQVLKNVILEIASQVLISFSKNAIANKYSKVKRKKDLGIKFLTFVASKLSVLFY